MSEEGWKGPWRCETCGLIGSKIDHAARWGELGKCGQFVPYERRAPDPEKAELVAALRKWLPSCLHKPTCKEMTRIPPQPCDCGLSALLRRIEEER